MATRGNALGICGKAWGHLEDSRRRSPYFVGRCLEALVVWLPRIGELPVWYNLVKQRRLPRFARNEESPGTIGLVAG